MTLAALGIDYASHGYIDLLRDNVLFAGCVWPTTACHEAAANGHLECLIYLASHVGTFSVGRSLVAAAKGGHVKCVEYLLKIGCDSNQHCVALRNAARGGHVECVDYMLKLGLKSNLRGAVNAAAANGHIDVLYCVERHGDYFDGYVLESAAANGHLECTKYLLEKGCSWWNFTVPPIKGTNSDCAMLMHKTNCTWTLDALAAGGETEAIKQFMKKGCAFTSRTLGFASLNGHLECVKFLCENAAPWVSDVTTNAAVGGHLECLRYLHEVGCPFNIEKMARGAAAGGHIGCLRYINENMGSLIKRIVINDAIPSGSIECYDYLQACGCQWGDEESEYFCDVGFLGSHVTFVEHAVKNGYPLASSMAVYSISPKTSIECAKYLLDNTQYSLSDILASTISWGNVEVLVYLRSRGAQWSSQLTTLASERGSFECLRYLHISGCPWEEKACRMAVAFQRLDCFRYLHENGCPWGEDVREAAQRSRHAKLRSYVLQEHERLSILKRKSVGSLST